MKNIKSFRLFENTSENTSDDKQLLAEIISKIEKHNEKEERKLPTDIKDDQLIICNNYIIIVNPRTSDHMNSHKAASTKIGEAPGSYYSGNWKECIKSAIDKAGEPESGYDKNNLSKIRWTAIDSGKEMGTTIVKFSQKLKDASLDSLPDEFKKYTYKRRNVNGEEVDETVIIKIDEGKTTNYVTVVAVPIGEKEDEKEDKKEDKKEDGKKVISLLTAFPDEMNGQVDGKIEIPQDRSSFPKEGLYFAVSKELFDQVKSEPTKEVESQNASFKYIKKFDRF